jgi:hypothetical protein
MDESSVSVPKFSNPHHIWLYNQEKASNTIRANWKLIINLKLRETGISSISTSLLAGDRGAEIQKNDHEQVSV